MAEKFVGIQLGCHSVFDEGADQCLDIMQKTAGVNAVFVYSHGDDRFAFMRPKEGIATDHPAPVKDPEKRKLATLWFHPHEKYYKGTILRHQSMPDREYDGRDIFDELIEPCRKRNIKLFGRALEAYSEHTVPLVDNWTKVLGVDVFGRIDHRPCFQNPDYRNFWLATVEDLFKSYPLDGFKYGAERSGPLANLITDGVAPSCFCDHCCGRARAEGINVERAKRGYRELYDFIQSCLHDDPAPSDGYHVTFVRILLKYPEILAWEYMWHQQKEDLARLMYGAIKTIKPQAKVGWHVYHSVTWQTIYRAEMNYADLVDYSDWLKPVVYHDVAGVRIRNRHLAKLKRTVLREVSEEDSLSLLYDFMGYDKNSEPSLDKITTTGMSPDYVYREVKRCVDGVKGRIPIYAGVGMDIPTDGNPVKSDPERVYRATYRAFEAGASGLVISREYDEMRIPNLEAVGRAIRDADAKGL